MADSKIHALVDGATPASTDEFVVTRSPYTAGNDRKLTWSGVLSALKTAFWSIFPTSVTSYGAVGDGSTDDTVAIQAAMNAVLGAGKKLVFPEGVYRITAALSIPGAAQWAMEGSSSGGTLIRQDTTNTPIFFFNTPIATSTGPWGWSIKNFGFVHNVAQPPANTSGNAIHFASPSSVTVTNFFNGTISGCNFDSHWYCLGSDSTKYNDIWGIHMRDCTVASTVSGGVARFRSSTSVGQPNNSFEDIYIRADGCNGPLWDMNAATNTWMTGIEINQSLLGPVLIQDSGGGSYALGAFKTEVGTYDSAHGGVGGCLFNLPNSSLRADYLLLQTLTLNASGMARPYVFNLNSSVSNAIIKVRTLDLNNTTVGNGTYWITNATSGGGGDVEIGSILRFPAGNFFLTDIIGTTSADSTRVVDWNNDRVSGDLGDADYTVVVGTSPNILSFETTLTANRVVTLPAQNAVAGNQFNGLRYRIVRSGLGAFTLTVKQGANTMFTFASGTGGNVEFMYRRNKWVQTQP